MADADLRSKTLVKGTRSARQIRFGLMDDYGARKADESIGERQLGPFILPPFQRPPAWSRDQQVKFIESIWLDLPIAAYVYNEAETGGGDHPDLTTDMWLVDGQQRWTAIHAYVAGEFEVFGHKFDDLSKLDRTQFMSKPFSVVETKTNDPELLREIYDRLAYGGTPHEPLAREEAAPSPKP